MIRLEHIEKTFGDHTVLKDVNLHLRGGEIFGLIGRNGAGKTTLISIIAGLYKPTGGECRLGGEVGYLPDVPAFFDFMTTGEYLDFLFKNEKGAKTRRNELLKLVKLNEKEKIRTLSRGMRQRLGLAAALVSDPDILLLDEPSSALDPMGRYELAEILTDLKNQGKAILLSTHILTDMEQSCDTVGFLTNGEIKNILSPKEVSDNPVIRITFESPVDENAFAFLPAQAELTDLKTVRIALEGGTAREQRLLLQKLAIRDNKITSVTTEKTDLNAIFREVCQ